MIRISPQKLKAARALVEWTGEDLAKQSGVALTSVRNFERGEASMTMETHEKLARALEKAGVRFTATGVEMVDNTITFFEGEDCYNRLLDDVIATLEPQKGEVLFSGADDRKSSTAVKEQVETMHRSGISTRFLIEEGNTYILGKLENYRWVPKDYFTGHDVSVIYADKIGFYLPTTPERVMLVHNPYLAEDYRQIFEFMWVHSDIPKVQ